LPWGVGVEAREGDHRPASHSAREVLERRGVRASPGKQFAHDALVLARLLEVNAKGRSESLVLCDPGRGLELGKRLNLDRVNIGQVLRDLILDAARRHVQLPTLDLAATRLPPSRNIETDPARIVVSIAQQALHLSRCWGSSSPAPPQQSSRMSRLAGRESRTEAECLQ